MAEVTVTEYDPRWPELYRQEAARLEAVLGGNLVRMFHIGSTSVPGLRAKPVIDMMGLVWDLGRVEACRPAFEGLGYKVLGECGIPGRRYMRRGGDGTPRTHHVHLYQFDDSGNILKDIAVREYLRCHPEQAAVYGELKSRLAQQFPEDYMGYCRGKEQFVARLSQQALAWFWREFPKR